MFHSTQPRIWWPQRDARHKLPRLGPRNAMPRAGNRLPQADLALSLAYDANGRGRQLVARAHSVSGERCLIALAGVAPTRN